MTTYAFLWGVAVGCAIALVYINIGGPRYKF